MKITCEINGRTVTLEADPGEMLTEVLRRGGYKSVKRGCETGSCGVCTVLVDDQPIASCCFPAARIENHRLTTVEGVPAAARALGKYLVAEGADQCGFCSPGLVLTVLAMQREFGPDRIPDDEEIRHYLAGNLCRCTGYVAQLRGIRDFLEVTS